MTPSQTPKAKRKSKLKMRYWNELDKAINHAMEKVWLLCELQCEKRQKDMRAKIDAKNPPKPAKVAQKSQRVKQIKYGEFGKKLK